jgi:hypothetical protein
LEDEVGKLRTMAEIITRTTDEKKGSYELKIEELEHLKELKSSEIDEFKVQTQLHLKNHTDITN